MYPTQSPTAKPTCKEKFCISVLRAELVDLHSVRSKYISIFCTRKFSLLSQKSVSPKKEERRKGEECSLRDNIALGSSVFSVTAPLSILMTMLSFVAFSDLQSGSAGGSGGGSSSGGGGGGSSGGTGGTGGAQNPAGPGGISQHLTYTSYILKQTPQVWSSVTGTF